MSNHVRASLTFGRELEQPLLEDRIAKRLPTGGHDGSRVVFLVNEVQIR